MCVFLWTLCCHKASLSRPTVHQSVPVEMPSMSGQLPHALRAAPSRRSPCAHHQPPITVSLAGVPPLMRIVHSHSGRTGLRLNPASPQDKNERSTVAVGATIGATLEDPDRQKSPLLRHAVVRPSAWRVPDHASPCSDPLHPHLGRLDPQTVKVPGSVVQGLLGSCTVSLLSFRVLCWLEARLSCMAKTEHRRAHAPPTCTLCCATLHAPPCHAPFSRTEERRLLEWIATENALGDPCTLCALLWQVREAQ